MAKFKSPRGKKSNIMADAKGAIPCLVVILSIFGLIMVLFYAVLKSGT